MTGLAVIQALRKKFRADSDAALAKKLGITAQAVLNWKKRKNLTPGNIARLTHAACGAGASHLQATAIRPLVEFFPISRSARRIHSENFQVFSTLEGGVVHPYRKGLKDEMSEHHGVYVFFDSRGQAIYAGKARQ